MTFNYAVWGLVGPTTWAAWLLGLAVALLFLPSRTGQRRRAGRLLAAAALALHLTFAATPIGYWLIAPLEERFPAPDLRGAQPEVIVVLAGAERLAASERSGRLELSYAGDRVLEGAALAQRFPRAELWIVGGIRLPGAKQADVDWTADTWRRLGVAPARIRAIGGTRDTCGNAAAIGKLLPRGTRPVLVTSAFHMPRSVACFRQAGVATLPYPVDYNLILPRRSHGGGLDALRLVDLALHEWAGLVWYRLRGRTAELLPSPR